jgi:protein-S-isoprenylcysteine O-methyltransferase Ste14
MAHETPFRIAAACLVVAAASTAAYRRIQAAKSGEKISRKDEGRLLFLLIRVGALPMLISMLLYLANPRLMQWSSVSMSDSARWAGAVLGAATIAFLFWTLRSLGTNLTDTVVTRRNHTLVTHGPYRWIRHPFYDCLLLLAVSLGMIAANWFIPVSGLYVFSMLAIRMSIEERKLIERFGDSYRTYMQSTGRFLPRLIPRAPR